MAEEKKEKEDKKEPAEPEEKIEEELKEETEELEKEISDLKEVIEEPQEEAKEIDEKEEKKVEEKKEEKEEKNSEQKDEILEMMKEDEEEKKAKEEAKEEEPEEEKDIGEELSLIKVKTKKSKKKKEGKEEKEEAKEEAKEDLTEDSPEAKIYALRTTANREDQVMDFVVSNAARKKLEVYSIIRPHGMRGYIFLEAGSRSDAEQAAFGVPYARGLLPNIIQYKEIEHMLEQVKKEMNIQKNDIAEIISGPFKREKCKITRIDRTKEEIVVELLEAAVPIPITVKMDAVRVIRRDKDEEEK